MLLEKKNILSYNKLHIIERARFQIIVVVS